MSVPGDFISAGELPTLVSSFSSLLLLETKAPSISTPRAAPSPPDPSLVDRAMSSNPDFGKLVASLSTNGLIKTSLNRIPELTGEENYLVWADQLVNVLDLCGIDKILTGDWTKPAVTADKATAENTKNWNTLDKWISINLTVSQDICGRLRHLSTSHEKWTELKKWFQPASSTSIMLHLTSIVNACFDQSTTFENFVTEKHEHNNRLKELGGTSLPDNYLAILIRTGLPDDLRQTVAHLPDDKISTQDLINIVTAHSNETLIQNTQASPPNPALLGRHRNRPGDKPKFEPCKTVGCPRPKTHPTEWCWAPGGPKHDPNRQKSNKKRKDMAHKVDEDDSDNDDSTTSLKICVDRSFVTKQSDSDLLYFSSTNSSTSRTESQAYLAKRPTPIIINSGTTSHIHNERLDFDFLDKDNTNIITGFGDGSIASSGRGTATFWTKATGQKGTVNRIALMKMMYVPSSSVSLLSVSRFDKAGCRIKFANGRCTISDARTGESILTGTMCKNLYYLDNINPDANLEVPMKVYHTTNSKVTLELMHRRLDHLNFGAVKKLFKKNMVSGVTLSKGDLNANLSICECCVRGKMQRTPFPKSSSHKSEILELVHSDLWGPLPVMSLGGKFYFISFTDDSSRNSWINYLHKKSEAFEAFKRWHMSGPLFTLCLQT